MKKRFPSLMLMITLFLVLGYLCPGAAYSQSPESLPSSNANVVPPETLETLRAIYEGNEFSAKSFRATWLPDGSAYVVLESEPESGRQILAHYDAASGKRTVFINPDSLSLPGLAGKEISIEDYQFSKNGKDVLLRLSNQNDENNDSGYWMLELKSGKIQQVVAGRNNSISPDGQKILFSKDGNLQVYDLRSDSTVALTDDDVAGSISNGQAVWSPNGEKIAFVRSDESGVKLRSALVPDDPSYPGVSETRFARVGGDIAELRVGITDALGKETRWVSLPMPLEGFYLGQIAWAGNSEELLVEQLNRSRTEREFFVANVNDATVRSIYTESDPDWVIASYNKNGGLEWLRDYSAFLVLSEKDGWRHAYVSSTEKEELKLLTPGEFDIIDRVKVDEAGGWFYYNASPENGTQKYLYRVRLDGKGQSERVTPKDRPGTHDYDFSPNAQWAFHTYSFANTPPVTELVKFPEHRVVRA